MEYHSQPSPVARKACPSSVAAFIDETMERIERCEEEVEENTPTMDVTDAGALSRARDGSVDANELAVMMKENGYPTEVAEEKEERTKRPWFRFGEAGQPFRAYIGKKGSCDDVKLTLLREHRDAFTPPPGTTRTSMHIWTPGGVEIGAMDEVYPHATKRSIFTITVDPVPVAGTLVWFKIAGGASGRTEEVSVLIADTDTCDDVKRALMTENGRAFNLPVGTTRSSMSLWTEAAVKIGARELFLPHAKEGRVFTLSVDAFAHMSQCTLKVGDFTGIPRHTPYFTGGMSTAFLDDDDDDKDVSSSPRSSSSPTEKVD
jgi:hypothetical protein